MASFLALLSGIAFCVCAGGAQADIVYEFTGTCTRVRDFNAERQPRAAVLRADHRHIDRLDTHADDYRPG